MAPLASLVANGCSLTFLRFSYFRTQCVSLVGKEGPQAQCFHQNRIQLLSITKKKGKPIRFKSVVRQVGPLRPRYFHFVSLNRKAKSIISLRYKSMILHTTLAGNISNLCYPLCAINLEACAGGRGRDGTCGLPLQWLRCCLLYTSPSPRDLSTSRMPSSA